MINRARTGVSTKELRPVEHRATWLAWGVALQAIGVGIPVTAALSRANREGVLGNLTHFTVRLIWREMLRNRADVALIVLGVALFAFGAVLLARPFVKRKLTLFVAVPTAAAAGVAVLGVIALLCAIVFAVIEAPGQALDDILSGIQQSSWWPSGHNRRKRGK